MDEPFEIRNDGGIEFLYGIETWICYIYSDLNFNFRIPAEIINGEIIDTKSITNTFEQILTTPTCIDIVKDIKKVVNKNE